VLRSTPGNNSTGPCDASDFSDGAVATGLLIFLGGAVSISAANKGKAKLNAMANPCAENVEMIFFILM
jgi:hypothetical protein